jgi:thiol-disulfide isomerase/thioredoxin
MRKNLLFFLILIIALSVKSQTVLTEAIDFHTKTIDGQTILLFPLLDEESKIVVIDFFSTSCGPCQEFAPDFQMSYENFGSNQGNVFFMGINWGNDNEGVHEFDSIHGLTYPTVSGTQGGGNIVFNDWTILSYPSVVVIKPDHTISNQYVWEPTTENINAAVLEAGGILVGENEKIANHADLHIFPSPAKNIATLSVSIETAENYNIELINLSGQIVFSLRNQYLNVGNNNIKLDVSNNTSGIYFVRLVSENGNLISEKLLIN